MPTTGCLPPTTGVCWRSSGRDGPNSETPPGHWNVLANEISDHAALQKRMGGVGAEVDDLEWDVKLYLALNGATHDAAIAAWGTKREYDYVRPTRQDPLSRQLGTVVRPQTPLVPSRRPAAGNGFHRTVTAQSIAPGGRHRNAYLNANRAAAGGDDLLTEAEMVGKVVVHAWNHEPDDPSTEVSGVDWILAENWVPYQDDNFVTPAFAAYVSGHSTFSRASAEVLAAMTGSEFFPGGLGEMTFGADFLDFEMGPTEEITLQWASYFDAADGGDLRACGAAFTFRRTILPGALIGSQIGQDAYAYAQQFFVSDNLRFHNRVQFSDVDNDGVTSPLDALLVINELNHRELSDPETGVLLPYDGVPAAFCDINDDNLIAPLDAPLVINELGDSQPLAAAAAIVPEPHSFALLWMALWEVCWCSGSGSRPFSSGPERGRSIGLDDPDVSIPHRVAVVLQVDRAWLRTRFPRCRRRAALARQFEILVDHDAVVRHGDPRVGGQLTLPIVLGRIVLGRGEIDVVGLPGERREAHVLCRSR